MHPGVPMYDEVPVPAGYRRTTWAELRPNDEVYMLGLQAIGPIYYPAAFGPYYAKPSTHHLTFVIGGLGGIQDHTDSRLLIKCSPTTEEDEGREEKAKARREEDLQSLGFDQSMNG